MASNSASVTIDLSQLMINLDNLTDQTDKAVLGLMSYWAGRVGSAAKTGAPWTDRSTNARSGLISGAGKKGSTHFIVLAHRVNYGVFLEIRWSGKYSIILPTLEAYGPKVMQSFEKLMQKYGVAE